MIFEKLDVHICREICYWGETNGPVEEKGTNKNSDCVYLLKKKGVTWKSLEIQICRQICLLIKEMD